MGSNSRRPGLQSRPAEGAHPDRLHLSGRTVGSLFSGAQAKVDPMLTVGERAAQALVIRPDRRVVGGLKAQPEAVMEHPGVPE